MKSNTVRSRSVSTQRPLNLFAAAATSVLAAVLLTACSSTAQTTERHSAEAKFSRAYIPQAELDQKPKQIHGSMLEAQHKLTDTSPTYDYDANAVFLVDEQGIPREIQCTNASSEAVAQAAITEISAWRFEPALQDGKPMVAKVVVAFLSTRPEPTIADVSGHGPQPLRN